MKVPETLKILLNEKMQKNCKIVFPYVSEHYASSFGTDNSKWPPLRGGGGLHVVNQE